MLRTTLDAVSWTRLATSSKLEPVPTPKILVGLSLLGSTDHSRVPDGENLSTFLP